MIGDRMKNERYYSMRIDETIQKLQTDYVDFYLLHALDNTKWEKCLELGLVDLCLDLQKQGKIKYFGFSFHDSYEVFEKIVNYRDWDFCQIQFNYMDTEEQAGLKGLKLCEEKGIPNIIMEPLKGGSLTKYSDDVEKMFKDYDNEASVASWGLRYVGSFDNVLVLLSGMSNIEQLEDNIKTFKDFKALNNEEEQIVESVVQKIRDRVKNGCTGCRYCMPCPKGVNIPKMFRMWNTASMYGIFDVVSWSYNNTKEEEFSTSCIKCGLCETKCPQQLNIREDLQKAHQFLLDMKNSK
jgi:predicted aldo/keto reductase-like oxidoreductase